MESDSLGQLILGRDGPPSGPHFRPATGDNS